MQDDDGETRQFDAQTDESGPVSGTVTSPRELALATDVLPVNLPIVPVVSRPMFPVQTLPIVLDEQPWMQTFMHMRETGQSAIGIIMVRGAELPPIAADNGGASNDSAPLPQPQDFHDVGTVAMVHQASAQNGKIQFIAEGRQRFQIQRWLSSEPPLIAQVSYIDSVVEAQEPEIKAYAMAIIGIIKKLIPLNPLYNEELKLFFDRFNPHQPAFLADFAANLTSASSEELQGVLETFDVLSRMQQVLGLLQKELEVVQLQARIQQNVEKSMTEQQRRFFLTEQLKVIQAELGLSKDDRTADVERFEERLGGLALSEEATARVDDELGKLSVLESGSPEYAVTRNYLDWVTSLPWGVTSEDNLDLERARRILDAEHSGLDDVKERITEFLAVGKLRGTVSGSIILLVGPPGVGKTSIGRSIAEALGREFYRFSLGGMRDEAEVKGHRRTYIGAMPGKFIQAMKAVGTSNPVIMLDEIDKIGASYQGDPASALLEVLDPEQNAEFLDHYVDLRFDLSNALFLCTANQLDTIPQPLLDRMETIRLSGYIAEEKVAIARQHLVPRQLERAGLTRSRLSVSDAALRKMVDGYAREAGVRGLEKQIGRAIRKAAVDMVKGKTKRVSVTAANLEQWLGQPYFAPERPMRGIGVITGLAWTALGGATLNIEASLVHTKNRGFRLTGNLGDVMRESAEIAYSYVAAHLEALGGDPAFFDEANVHLHVPEGATPKDGPSAGVSMASALLSLARGEQCPRPVAMTGELTLTGQVLAVGGIREKVIAARRTGIHEVILPEANRRDVAELPAHVMDGLAVHYARRYQDVFDRLFAPKAHA